MSILFQWLLMAVCWFWLAACSSPVSPISGFSDSPKKEFKPNAPEYSLTKMFLENAEAGKECPLWLTALHDFEEFHNTSIKKIEAIPTYVMKLPADAAIEAIVNRTIDINRTIEKILARFKAENQDQNKNLTDRFETMETHLQDQSKSFTAMETHLKDQSKTFTAMETHLQDQSKSFTAMETHMQDQSKTFTAMETHLKDQSKTFTAMETDLKDQNQKMNIQSCMASLETRIQTLKKDVGILLLPQAVNVAAQAMLVIVGAQPIIPMPASNRFSALMRSDPEFQAMMKKSAHNQATVRCRQIDTMTKSRGKVEHPTDLAQFKAVVVKMADVLRRYNSPEAQHRTALWVLHHFENMLRESHSRRPAAR
jgi:hypothetical protein